MSKILELLFGKRPDIFDNKGHVSHKLPKKTWSTWHIRTKIDPRFNWRNHTGVTGEQKSQK